MIEPIKRLELYMRMATAMNEWMYINDTLTLPWGFCGLLGDIELKDKVPKMTYRLQDLEELWQYNPYLGDNKMLDGFIWFNFNQAGTEKRLEILLQCITKLTRQLYGKEIKEDIGRDALEFNRRLKSRAADIQDTPEGPGRGKRESDVRGKSNDSGTKEGHSPIGGQVEDLSRTQFEKTDWDKFKEAYAFPNQPPEQHEINPHIRQAEPMMWVMRDLNFQTINRYLNDHCKRFEVNVTYYGSVVNQGWSNHDLDVMLIPMGGYAPDPEELFRNLAHFIGGEVMGEEPYQNLFGRYYSQMIVLKDSRRKFILDITYLKVEPLNFFEQQIIKPINPIQPEDI